MHVTLVVDAFDPLEEDRDRLPLTRTTEIGAGQVTACMHVPVHTSIPLPPARTMRHAELAGKRKRWPRIKKKR
jgi:hypothetical protein